MTPAELATLVRFKTRTNSTTFTDAQILALLKEKQQELVDRCVKEAADEDLFLITYTENLVLNQRQYPFQNDFLRLKKVEAKLDGTNWLVLKEMQLGNYDNPTDEDSITAHFANLKGQCFYQKMHQGIYVYSGSITAVTNGLKTKYQKNAQAITDLSSSTDMAAAVSNTAHGIPLSLHNLLVTGICIDYKSSREKPIPLNETEQKYEFNLKKAIAAIKEGNQDREIIGELPPASDRGNDGQDY